MNIRLTPAPSTDPGIAVFDVQADCEPGSFSAYLAYPKEREARYVARYGDAQRRRGQRAAGRGGPCLGPKTGLCVLDFNVHGLPNERIRLLLCRLGERVRMFECFLFGRDDRELDVLSPRWSCACDPFAIDVITAQPHSGTARRSWYTVAVQGGAQAVMAGCLDPRVDLVCAEIPAMCDRTAGMAADIALPDGRCWWNATGRARTDARQLKAARYYDVVNFARHVTVPTYVTAGIMDSLLPTDHRICDVQSAQGREAYARASYYGAYPDLAGRGFLAAGRSASSSGRRERDTGR